MDAISNMEFDYVASGHYANVIHPSADQMEKPSVLELSKDMVSTNGCIGLYFILPYPIGSINHNLLNFNISQSIVFVLTFAYILCMTVSDAISNST